jgi:UDP-N-acetylmuramate dehydrogenase
MPATVTEEKKPLIRENILIKEFTSFKTGGVARFFAEPTTIPALHETFQWLNQTRLPYITLGEGTNVLIGSGIYPGLVLRMVHLKNIVKENSLLVCEAGVNNSDLASYLLENEWTGGEFLHGLPGSLGGSAVMNARCYGQQMADIIQWVDTFDETGQEHRYNHEELQFGYKSTVLQAKKELVIRLGLQFQKGKKTDIQQRMIDNKSDRENNHQYTYPSAGCIFKNPYEVGIPAGKIIEELGWKGKRLGRAEVYEHHANFIINREGATSEEILALAKAIQQDVQHRKGIRLDFEVRILGQFLPLPRWNK